ncbi:MAG TPA: hypothetical protein VK337_06530, partial [Xanthobacteraceae bacterium]|nr:hypothetical protein [Xanthobacteraceae bacterium]
SRPTTMLAIFMTVAPHALIQPSAMARRRNVTEWIDTPDRVAALIAWMLVVRIDDLVKDGAKRRRLRRSTILDKIINANRVLSKRSRPLSGP